MKPGIYYDIPFAEYLKIDAISNSFLKRIAQSPAHAIAPFKGTSAMREGRILHTLILEPEKQSEVITTAPEGSRNSTAFKQAVEKQFGITYPGKWADAQELISAEKGIEVVDAERLEWFKQVAKQLKETPEVYKLLKGTQREVTIIWEREGHLCKARIDALGAWAVDLKTAADSSPEGFSRSAFNFGYHRQDAWYMNGCKELGIEAHGMAFIALEKEQPINPMIYTFGDEERAIAEAENEYLFQLAVQCKTSGTYPGYEHKGGRVHTLELPGYYKMIGE